MSAHSPIILEASQRQRRAADPKASVWVGASAGTGKTKVLSDRVLALLLSGAAPERLLCLTFTKAAAAEMANRVMRRLSLWATEPESEVVREIAELTGAAPDGPMLRQARRLFARVLDAPGGLRIQTLHAFAQSLLRRFPLEAGIAPHFSLIDDKDAQQLLTASRDRMLLAAASDPAGALAQALAVVTAHAAESTVSDLLAGLVFERGRLRRLLDRYGDLAGFDKALRRRLGLREQDTPESILAAACMQDLERERSLRKAAAALAQGSDTDAERGRNLSDWLAAKPSARQSGWDDYCEAFLTKAGQVRKTLITKAAQNKAPDALDILASEALRVQAVLAHIRAAQVAQCSLALMRLGDDLLSGYERLKAAHAQMDYDDLILATRRLLESADGAAWVLYKLDGGLDHVLIDEAQDTNPDQWAIIGALTAEFFAGESAREDSRTVFAVGDVKQSIYSFQRADPRAFEAMRAHLAESVPAAGRQWDEVGLAISFRSVQAVLDAVDAVFLHDGRGVADSASYERHIAARQGHGGMVEVWPPLELRPMDAPVAWKPPVERLRADPVSTRMARLLAKRIALMIGREELPSRGRAIRAGDIMVLVRKRGGFVEDLVRELKSLRVPVAGVDRMELPEQMAVMDLMAAATFVLLPEDDLNLAALLKSPLLGFSEDDLFELAHGRKASLWAALRARGGEPAFAFAYRELAYWLSRADFAPPYEFFAEILGPRGGRKRLLARLGLEAEDPIDEFLSQALAYERAHPPVLQGFLQSLSGDGFEIKRDLEQARFDSVRVMTVHGAKGLQAPVVFLPDSLQAPAPRANLYWVDEDTPSPILLWPPKKEYFDPVCETAHDALMARQEDEYRRLLYVAMTRAEDRLIVCGWSNAKTPSWTPWYDLARAALEPLAEKVEDSFLAQEKETEGNQILRLMGAQTAPITKAPAALVEDVNLPLPPFATTSAPTETIPSRPLQPSRPDGEEPAAFSPLGEDGKRFQRGIWIHRLLQFLPDMDPARQGEAGLRLLRRLAPALTDLQRKDLLEEVQDVLRHSDYAPIFGPGSRPEVAITGVVDGRAVSGQIDRLVVSPDSVWIIDFKSNRPPPEKPADIPEIYRSQMQAYMRLLQPVYPGRNMRAALLWTAIPRIMWLDESGA